MIPHWPQYVNYRNELAAGQTGDLLFQAIPADKRAKLLKAQDPTSGRLTRLVRWCVGRTPEWRWSVLPLNQKLEGVDRFLQTQVKQKLAQEKVAAAAQQAKEEPDANFPQASSELSLAQRVRCFWSRSPGIAHMQGRRKEMEDEDLTSSFSLKTGEKAQVYGIFDGHGGRSAAQFAKENLTLLLQKALDRYGSSDEGVFAAFKEAFEELDQKYLGNAGSTLNVAIRIGDALWVCNVGDTRAILVEEGEVTQLSKDQSPDDPQIKRGIIKRGGFVKNMDCPRVGGLIAVGRVLGDRCAQGMVHTPKITKMDLKKVKPGAHLVIACDGVWDVASTNQAGAFIQECIAKKFSCKEMAERLILKAFNAISRDNLSALVVRL